MFRQRLATSKLINKELSNEREGITTELTIITTSARNTRNTEKHNEKAMA